MIPKEGHMPLKHIMNHNALWAQVRRDRRSILEYAVV